MESGGEIERLNEERHGAIRVGTAAELSMLRRLFAVMGLVPVGYYDLAPAGLPVHSTAFRPVTTEALSANAFRIFCSLLRIELIEDAVLREKAAAILASRQIVNDEAQSLVAQHERDGGLNEADAQRFVAAALETFRWHGEALVDGETYRALSAAHRLIADIVCFRGPHINHLTPRTLDIDAAQAEMIARGIKAKAVIEGPPRRAVPILLRQTSFAALEETISFRDGDALVPGAHTARFGEIEQRGVALTPKGRALYDELLAKGDASAFAAFPDDAETLRREGLAYFAQSGQPITYEDFLPVSAAGIFRSNLGEATESHVEAASSQAVFEEALGAPVQDPFALYAAQQDMRED
jgi:uncharacterized glyoxalase superfamily metalloenzyme YdcJ